MPPVAHLGNSWQDYAADLFLASQLESDAMMSSKYLINIVLMAGMVIFIGRWIYGKGRRPSAH
jgi:hypothetical protein